MGSRVLLRKDSNVLRKSYLKGAVGTPQRALLDEPGAPSMLFRGQFEPSLEINYVDDPRLAVGETFTRATIATVVDFEGLVRQVPSGEARFYGFRRVENLINRTAVGSENIHAWTMVSCTGAVETFVRHPQSAVSSRLVPSVVGGRAVAQLSYAVGAGAEFVAAVDLKDGGAGILSVFLYEITTGTDFMAMQVNLQTGGVSSGAQNGVTGITYTSEPIGDGWWRVWIYGRYTSAIGGTMQMQLRADGSTALNQAFYASRAQVENVTGQASKRTAEYVSVGKLAAPYHGANVDGVKYFPTTTTGALIARYTDTATTPGRRGLQRERASTNLCLQSADFSTTWAASNATIGGSITAPDGSTATKSKLQLTAAVGVTHNVLQSFVKAASALPYVYTVWARAAEYAFLAFRIDDGGANGCHASFNLTTGAVATAAAGDGVAFTALASQITAYPGGWYRCEIRFTTNTAAVLRVVPTVQDADGNPFSYTFTATLNSGLYLWGSQLEQVDRSSSYIPTTTVAVTRNADTCSLPIATAWFNTTQGTLAGEGAVDSIGLDSYLGGFFKSGGNPAFALRCNSAGTLTTIARDAGGLVHDGIPGQSAAAMELIRMAGSYDGSGAVKCSAKGSAVAAGAGMADVNQMDTFEIGSGYGSAMGGYISRLWYVPRAIPDALLPGLLAGI